MTKKVKNIEVTFVDINNENRVLVIPKSRFKYAKNNHLKFDGSSICGINNVDDSDIFLDIDKSAEFLLPNNNLMIMANTSFENDARHNLQELEKKLKRLKYKVYVGAELEFFLFDTDLKNVFKHCIKPKDIKILNKKYIDDTGYFGHSESCFKVLNDITEFCNKNNIEIEQFHHECGINQFEIDFKYDTPTKTADRVVFLKYIINYFANKHGMFACFMPKPLKNVSGSGMHINISVFKNKKNIFYDKNGKFGISNFARNFIQGIFNHISSITAITNPIKNSYYRLNSNYETPTNVTYNIGDRTALVRIPKANKKSSRIELRSPDIASNPYLSFLVVIMSGFEWILEDNFSEKQFKYKNIKNLSKSLIESKIALLSDEYISKALPKNFGKSLK